MAGHARVLLAEDHPAVLEQLRLLLSESFDVIACVRDGYALYGAALALRPHVIVSDVNMPGMDGIDAATRIRQAAPEIAIVFISVHDDPAVVERGLQTGALGYVLKNSAGEELPLAVRAALRGERYVSSTLHGA